MLAHFGWHTVSNVFGEYKIRVCNILPAESHASDKCGQSIATDDDLIMLPLPFVSAWDPRATSSGSIDPLGAIRTYNALATTLLPGITTVTTQVRYLSWICAGLHLLDELPDAPNGGQDGRIRRQRVLAWERLVALATGWYATSSKDNGAWGGLRGISYVKRAVAEQICSVDFPLLKNQAGVGGIGTYWVALVRGGLVEDASARLTRRGVELAGTFLEGCKLPRKALRAVLAKECPRFTREQLVALGRCVNLDSASIRERERILLADALLEPLSHRRIAAALNGKKHVTSDQRNFQRLRKRLLAQRESFATELADVVAVIQAFEALHTPLLDGFNRLRSASIHGAPVPLGTAAGLAGLPHDLVERGEALQRAIDAPARALPVAIVSVAREFLGAIQSILHASTAEEFVRRLVRHHERVQSGKLDASRQPKQPWMVLVGDRGTSIKIAPRFALDELPLPREDGSFTHPYRLEAFAGLLTEVHGWAARP